MSKILLYNNPKKEKRKGRTIYCNILEHEIPLSRCEPVKLCKKCISCEGYVLKPKLKAELKKKHKRKKVPEKVIIS